MVLIILTWLRAYLGFGRACSILSGLSIFLVEALRPTVETNKLERTSLSVMTVFGRLKSSWMHYFRIRVDRLPFFAIGFLKRTQYGWTTIGKHSRGWRLAMRRVYVMLVSLSIYKDALSSYEGSHSVLQKLECLLEVREE